MQLVKFSYFNPQVQSIPQKPKQYSRNFANTTHKITFRYVDSESTSLFTSRFDKECQTNRNVRPEASQQYFKPQLDASDVSTLAQQQEKIKMQMQMLRSQLYQSVQQYSALLERRAQSLISINSSLQQRNLAQMELQNAFLSREQELQSLYRLLDNMEFE